MVVLRHPPRRRQLPGRGALHEAVHRGRREGSSALRDGRARSPGRLAPPMGGQADAAGFHAAADRCDVTIGPNTFRNLEWGEPLKYRIQVQEGPPLLDIDLTGQVPPWRPGTGYMYFGE